MRHGDRYVINGEKWFVTSGDEADYIIVHAIVDGDPGQADAVPGRHELRRASRSSASRSSPTPMCSVIPSSCSRMSKSTPSRVLGGIGAGARAHQGLVRRGTAADRRQLPRRGDPGVRAGQRLGGAPRPVRHGRSASTRRSNSCWPTWPSTSWRRKVDDLSRRLGDRPGDRPQGRACACQRDQAARLRDGRARARQGRADLRRARLHARKSRRAAQSRRARRPHLGRHVRDPARDHRQPARKRGTGPFTDWS